MISTKMNTPEQHYFKVFASEMFPDYENNPVIFAEARATWNRTRPIEDYKEMIIARWEDEC